MEAPSVITATLLLLLLVAMHTDRLHANTSIGGVLLVQRLLWRMAGRLVGRSAGTDALRWLEKFYAGNGHPYVRCTTGVGLSMRNWVNLRCIFQIITIY